MSLNTYRLTFIEFLEGASVATTIQQEGRKETFETKICC